MHKHKACVHGWNMSEGWKFSWTECSGVVQVVGSARLDLMRLEAHVGDVRSVHTYSMYTCSACPTCQFVYETYRACIQMWHPYIPLLCIRNTAHPTHFTWGSTDAPPCSNGSCHSVIDGAWWAQLVPPALTHLLLTWGNTSPLLVLIGRRLIGSIDNVNTFIENQD